MALEKFKGIVSLAKSNKKIETPLQRRIEENRKDIIGGIKEESRGEILSVIKSGNESLNGLLTNVGVVGSEFGNTNMSIYLTSMTNGILTRILENGGMTHDLVKVSNELVKVAREDDMGLRTRMIIGMCESILKKNKNYRVGEVSQRMPELFAPWVPLMSRIVKDKKPLIEQLKRGERDERKAEKSLLRVGEIVSKRGNNLATVANKYNDQIRIIEPMKTINIEAERLASNMRLALMQDSPVSRNDINNLKNNRNEVKKMTQETVKKEQLKMRLLSGLNVINTDEILVETSKTILSAAVWNRISTEFGVSAAGLIALAGMAQAVEIAAMMNMYLASKVLSVQKGVRDNSVINIEAFKASLVNEQNRIDQFSNILSSPLIIDG